MDFNALRLLLASSVAVAHFSAITLDGPTWLPRISPTVAVQAFFVISGWIVTASYIASSSIGAFYVRRFARLVPLYVVVVVLQGLLVLAMYPDAPRAASELFGYLGANLAFANFLRPSLLGFLDGAPVQAINPSLWTLKIEVMFYASVPLWVLLTRRHGRAGLAAIFLLSTAYLYLVSPYSTELAKQLPGQMRFFVAGMACRELYEWGHRTPPALPAWAHGIAARVLVAIAGVAALVVAQRFDDTLAMAALQPLWVALFVVAMAWLLPSIGRAPDISYGVYLIHAPLFQFAQAMGWLPGGGTGFVPAFAVCVLLSTIAAYAVERPAIRSGQRWSRRYSGGRRPERQAVA